MPSISASIRCTRPLSSCMCSRLSPVTLVAEVLLDPLREVRDAAQRRLEVMRRDVGELIELLVRSLELARQARQLLGLALDARARHHLGGDVHGVHHDAERRTVRRLQRLVDEVDVERPRATPSPSRSSRTSISLAANGSPVRTLRSSRSRIPGPPARATPRAPASRAPGGRRRAR